MLGQSSPPGYPAGMFKHLSLLSFLLWTCSVCAAAGVLFVADEFPAMEYLARELKSQEGVTSKLVSQTQLPQDLSGFDAVVVYIHLGLAEPAERAFIHYAEGGGRLVLLHHSISSGKRQNRAWFSFLGVELPQGDLAQGGYKWIEGVTAEWQTLATNFIMTNRVEYLSQLAQPPKQLPSFTLTNTEVYLNHRLTGQHIPLLSLHYTDPKTGKTWNQDTAGWLRPAGKGWIVYFMPGHTIHDFENPAYGRIVLNAITARREHIP